SVKRSGEAAGAGLLFNLAIPANLPAGTLQELEITGLLAGDLGASSAGTDYVSVFFLFPVSPGLTNATVLGLRFVYDPIPVASIPDGSVTLAKMAANSVDSAKIVNGSIRAVDVNPGQVQLRVTQGCGVGASIRAIQADGTVVCEPDTVGMLGWARVSSPSTCHANARCLIGSFCGSNGNVMGGGVELDEEPVPGGAFDNFEMVDSHPETDQIWSVAVNNRNAFDVHIIAWVVCSRQAFGAGSPLRNEVPPPPIVKE